jgi:hypothetical protein
LKFSCGSHFEVSCGGGDPLELSRNAGGPLAFSCGGPFEVSREAGGPLEVSHGHGGLEFSLGGLLKSLVAAALLKSLGVATALWKSFAVQMALWKSLAKLVALWKSHAVCGGRFGILL